MLHTLLLFQKVALVGGMLHSMVPGAKPAPGTILFDHGLIEAIGSSVDVPKDAKRIDISGKHVIPGLVDGKVNFDPDHDRLYLSCGVTLVREVGADCAQMTAERDSISRDVNPGPSLWIAGAILDGAPPASRSAAVITTPQEGVDWASRLLHPVAGDGVNYLSFYPGLTKDCWNAVIALAHREVPQRQVWGMLPKDGTLEDALQAGQDGLFGIDYLLPAGKKRWNEVSDEEIAAIAKRVGQSKLAITPTLALYASLLVPPPEKPQDLKYLGPIQVSQWLADGAERRRIFTAQPELLQQNLDGVKKRVALLRALQANGVALVPGSSCGMAPWLLPGEALLNELSLWVGSAGIDCSTALHLATSGAAARIGAARLHGTLEVGKRADLVVTSADPELDLAPLHRPDYVVIRGRVLAAQELDELRAQLATRQQELQARAFKPLDALPRPSAPAGEPLLAGLVETRYSGQRISGERFAVARMSDGTLVYAARALTFGSFATKDTDTELVEKVLDGRLIEFGLTSTRGPEIVTLKGVLAGGTLNIESRLNGVFDRLLHIREKVAFLETGSVLTDLILGQSVQAGQFQALFLENFAVAISDKWNLHVDPATGQHLLSGPQGERVVDFAPDGAPLKCIRESASVDLVRTLLEHVPVKAGLPVPAKKNPDPPQATPPASTPPKK